MAEIFDVFISYRRSDGQALARELYSYLDKKGVRVFLDEVKLLDGDFFDTQLRDKLICAPHYVLIGTTEAFTVREGEDWVKNEMELAVDEQEKAAPGERTITVLQPHDAKIPDVLPGKLGRAVKVQRIIMRFGVDSDEYFGKVFDVVTKVSKRNLWQSAHRWLEKSKRQGGRFARLHIDESIMPKAGDFVRRSEMPVNVNINKQDGDEAPLLNAITATDEHLFLIGQGGIGKTTSLMKIMDDEYADRSFSCESQIPIFVELSYAPDNDGRYYEQGKSSFIRRSIFKQIRERDFDSHAVLNGVEAKDNAFTVSSETAVLPINELFTKRTERPEFLLLLDGLNEVSLAKVKNTENSVIDLIRGEIRYLINECPNVRVILTSRSDDACGYFSELKRLYLTGVDEESIKKYLEDCKMSQAQIAAALSDEHLKDTLKIPLFLTMYATLKNKDGVCTQGEILRCFFHERRENIGVYTVQDRIARVGENAAASEAVMDKTRLTVEMQNFIIDLILPEIGRYMENNGEFHISRKVLREIISKVLDGREDTDFCGICGDDAFRIGNRQGATREPSMIADEIKEKFADNKNRITASIIECLIYSLGIMQMNTDESGYGFMHQHVRDFFAAMSYINAMRLAVYLYKDGEKAAALSVMNERFKDKPVGMQVRRFIGEALGEHHNAPYYDNGWKQNAPENDPLRGLITRTLNIYRGVNRKDGGYGVWSLVHILNEVRGELSGMNFSGIDFTRCSLNGMRLSRKGVEARFEKAILSYNELNYQGHSGIVLYSISFSHDGKLIVTASDDETAKLWDAYSLDLLGTMEGHSGYVRHASFSPNDDLVVTASKDQTAIVWSVKERKKVGILSGHSAVVLRALFNNDGSRILTVSEDCTARVWDVNSLDQVGLLCGHKGSVNSAAFSPNSESIVTASGDGTIKIWNANTYKLLGTIEAHSEGIYSVTYSSDGRQILSASSDGTAKVWDSLSLENIGIINGWHKSLYSAAFSPDGNTIITCGNDNTVGIWDSVSFSLLDMIVDTSRISSAMYSQDGKYIATSTLNGSIKIWESRTLCLCHDNEQIYPDWYNNITYNTANKRFVSVGYKTVRIWDAEKNELEDVVCGLSRRVNVARYSLDGALLLVSDHYRQTQIFDSHSLIFINEFAGGMSELPENNPLLSNETKIITLRQDYHSMIISAKIWSYHTNELLKEREYCNDAAFSSDGRYIAMAIGTVVEIWSAITFIQIGNLAGHSDIIHSVSFSSDSSTVISASSDGTVKIWDVNLLLCSGTLYLSGSARQAVFSPKGDRIATLCLPGLSQLWDAKDLSLIGNIDTVTRSISFGRDADVIYTVSWDGTIKVFDLKTFNCKCVIPNIPGLILVGVDLTKLDQRVKFTDKEKELLRMYGAKI